VTIWQKYRTIVYDRCDTDLTGDGGLQYWRDRLFVETIIFMLPLSLIAVFPGVIISFTTGFILLGIYDIMAAVMIAFTAFVAGISLVLKKGIFLFCVFALAVILVYYLGLFGPGLLYFFSGSIFAILFLPTRTGIISAVINLIICIVFGIMIYNNSVPWQTEIEVSLGTWIAVSSNLVFLSLLMAVLIPKLFYGLQSTIEAKTKLELDLKERNKELTAILNELEIKRKEVEEFSLLAAHDLKEPLRNINTMLRIIERDHIPDKNEKVDRYLSIVNSSSKRMINLIEDLTAYTQVGIVRGEHTQIDLNKFLDEIFEAYREQIESFGGKITLHPLPVINSILNPLDRLFQNLISNSIKYKSKNKPLHIEIWSTEDDECFKIYFKDNGTGIAENFIPNAFGIFNRFHDEVNYEGSGLGLATCKKVAKLLGGDITLKSGTGLGCEFCITLLKG